MVALRLLHVDIRDEVGVGEDHKDNHLLARSRGHDSKLKEDAEGDVPDGKGKDTCLVEVLHAISGNETGLVLDDGPGAIPF